MTKEELQDALYDRMAAEQQKYRDWLLGQSPQAVMDHACEYTIREDIVMTMEMDESLSPAQLKALLRSQTPLADIYKAWQDTETHHMDDVRNVVETRANSVIQQEKSQREGR